MSEFFEMRFVEAPCFSTDSSEALLRQEESALVVRCTVVAGKAGISRRCLRTVETANASIYYKEKAVDIYPKLDDHRDRNKLWS